MIELKKEFHTKTGDFKQLYKKDGLAVYQITRKHDNGVITHWYEVFQLKAHKPNNFVQDYYEIYPSSSNFGDWAWSCSNEESVLRILRKHFPEHNVTKGLETLDLVWRVS
jgi:hypothetical protein